MSEQNLVNAILDYLALRKIKAVHHKTVGHIVKKDGSTIFGGRTRADQRGAPDILFAYLGYAVSVEVKSPTGRLRPEQEEWITAFRSAPNYGYGYVARSLDDVEKILDQVKAHCISSGAKETQIGDDTL